MGRLVGANGALGSSHLERAHNLLRESPGSLTAPNPNRDSSPGAGKTSAVPRASALGLEWRSWLFWERGSRMYSVWERVGLGAIWD